VSEPQPLHYLESLRLTQTSRPHHLIANININYDSEQLVQFRWWNTTAGVAFQGLWRLPTQNDVRARIQLVLSGSKPLCCSTVFDIYLF
jgi:hypothetical protein